MFQVWDGLACTEEIPQDRDPEDVEELILLPTEAGEDEDLTIEQPRCSKRNKRSAAPIAEEPPSAQRAEPEDLEHPGLNPDCVKIWRIWLQCFDEMSLIPTIDNQQVTFFAPMLPWFASAGVPQAMLWLHYCPIVLAELLGGRHPSTAMNSAGSLLPATWEFLQISLGDRYYSLCGKLNIVPFAYKYHGKPTDIYTIKNFNKIMKVYAKFVLQVFEICGKNDFVRMG